MNPTIKKYYRRVALAYLRYKDWQYYSLSLYLGVILAGIIMLVYAVIPEVSRWFSIQEEVRATRERIGVMENNLQLLQALNATQLEDDFTTASTALPPTRDISLLLSAINFAAIKTGVGMDDFTFQGGKLSSLSTAETAEAPGTDNSIVFTVKGSLSQIISFLGEIQEKMPVLSLSSVDAQFSTTESAQVKIAYFYKPFPLIPQDNSVPITDISAENKTLLQKLKSWSIPLGNGSDEVVGSEAASPL